MSTCGEKKYTLAWLDVSLAMPVVAGAPLSFGV